MLEIKKQKKKTKKQTNKHYIVLNLEVCGISSVGGKGLVVCCWLAAPVRWR